MRVDTLSMDYVPATNALLEALRFTPAETAAKLGVSEGTLANWRSQRKGPNRRTYRPGSLLLCG